MKYITLTKTFAIEQSYYTISHTKLFNCLYIACLSLVLLQFRFPLSDIPITKHTFCINASSRKMQKYTCDTE